MSVFMLSLFVIWVITVLGSQNVRLSTVVVGNTAAERLNDVVLPEFCLP